MASDACTPKKSKRETRGDLLVVYPHLRYGGAERVLSWLTSELSADNYRVTILTWHSQVEDFFPLHSGIRRLGGFAPSSQSIHSHRLLRPIRGVYYWISKIKSQIQFLLTLRHEMKAHDFSLAFLSTSFLWCLISSRRHLRQKLIVSFRIASESEIPWLRLAIKCGILRRNAQALVVQTESIKKMFEDIGPLPVTHVIPNAALIGSPNFIPTALKDLVVLNVARLEKYKNQKLLLESWAEVCHNNKNWRLQIVGEGSMHHELIGLSAKLGIESSVHFLGRQTEVSELYRKASIYVSTSDSEGMSNSLLEALAHSCACVATDEPGGGCDIALAKHGGIVIPRNNRGALTSALRALMTDEDLRSTVSLQGFRNVRALSSKSTINAWKDVFVH